MSDESQFIDGIYNYCDRWCERCPLTARCRLFSDERDLREEAAIRSDEDNADFWESLEDVALQTLEAADGESDPEFEVDMAEIEAREERLDQLTERDPLVQLAHDYAMAVHQWLDAHQADWPSEENRFRARRDAITPAEALEVIGWHGFQIAAKLSRAMRGHFEAVEELEEAAEEFEVADEELPDALESWDTGSPWADDEDYEEEEIDLAEIHQHDADGSGKVALLGIERSIGAWTILRDAYPQEDAQLQKFLRQLIRMRHLLEQALPDARSFQRPGFDD
jgi:hypothetical protein